jgi:hypothetical protein
MPIKKLERPVNAIRNVTLILTLLKCTDLSNAATYDSAHRPTVDHLRPRAQFLMSDWGG